MTKKEKFLSVIAPLAQAEYTNRAKWVLPSVCIAQGALESGWNADAKTLFGIKGHGITTKTKEFLNGKYVTVTDSFKKYPDIASAVDGYYDLITTNKRYSGAVNNNDYTSAITAIKKGGYATDPDYVKKIISIIKSNNLTKYDIKLNVSKKDVPASAKNSNKPVFKFRVNYTVTASALRVRTSPSTSGKIKKTYKKGTVFTCYETKEDTNGSIWCRTPSGWVCGYYAPTKEVYAK